MFWFIFITSTRKIEQSTPQRASRSCPGSQCSSQYSTSNTWSNGCSTPFVSWNIHARNSKFRFSTIPPTKPLPWPADLVERYAALGNPITYHHRTNREGFKAGALAEGMKTANGEFIAIFDADFAPPEDFLLRTIHHFTDSKIGMVQTRWTHINRNYSFLTQVEAILLDGHFVLEHSGRARSGVFFNFNGTAGVWRRNAIEEAAAGSTIR